MAKDKTKKAKPDSELPGLMEKAVARGEKLRKTLTKIAGQAKLDAGHPAQTLLKALDKTLGKLRSDGEPEVEAGAPVKITKVSKKAADKADEPPTTPRTSRTRKAAPEVAAKAEKAPAAQAE
ncbi:hypothetical protein BB934_26210 [Microvirga ossetica]|uniref:Uncharacterized protein n=1 Tax=Microvirga ossetica TaxID=1882682 RepID=A0A1B2EMT7_9HYPH|nr:hypothetical protein [Microvirga ossetica]ANY81280.1 hypothetical protein BB934_26210 [Microvirga ossetica]